jgi:NitT/TauT family transport system ATP-binding protein
MTAITIDDVTKRYPQTDGSRLAVLDEVAFDTDTHDFVSILGPSGCGKSTLLSIISGLESPSTGEVTIGEAETPADVTFVFQEPRLLDWRTVKENVTFALKSKGVPESTWDERVERYLSLVGLDEFADEYPQSLSGGMKQRVAIARAMAIEPDVILMDEPFSSLDEITARELRSDLIDIWQHEEQTILFITHNAREAAYLSNRVLVLSSRPATIVSDSEVTIERPRSPDDPDLVELGERLVTDLHTGT